MEQLKSLDDAIRIINKAAGEAASGAAAVWVKLDHARAYLNSQVKELLLDTTL